MEVYDFSGWATKNDIRCSDGRVILKDAFKHNSGQTVPLVWNHRHNESFDVLGHAMLENRDEGVYAYCKFNDTESGQNAKLLVQHGDVRHLSIYANQLKQQGSNVMHGMIREVSLVLAGANPGAFIDSVMQHGEEEGDGAIISFIDESTSLQHADEPAKVEDKKVEKEDDKMEEKEKTIKDVIDSMTEEQKEAMYAVVGMALEGDDKDDDVKHNFEGGSDEMKHNVFDGDEMYNEPVLTHADEMSIINMAKSNGVGSFQDALSIYAESNEALQHAFKDEDYEEYLFPEYKDVKSGAPELLSRDQGWVSTVMSKTHKSPISRIRTKQADARDMDQRAYGYKKGTEKKLAANLKLMNRTTDPQTIYIKDKLNRDDIIDITDFDVVSYLHGVMRQNLNEEIARAIMIGDGREDGDADRIYQEHIRSIWHDEDLYSIHQDVDIKAARNEIQGTDTNAHFGENYIYAEAIITAALYSREQYKGSGNVDFYCTPHLLNVMLLARDLNGRRIYDSKSDLAAALNVGAIHTVEQFEGQVRTTKDGGKKKLLGIFVNLSDYSLGSTKGGEITSFNQFDIDFNQEKYLIETRLSGALTKVYSAICLEEPVTEAAAG